MSYYYKSFYGVSICEILKKLYGKKEFAYINKWLDKPSTDRKKENYAAETAMLPTGRGNRRKKGTAVEKRALRREQLLFLEKALGIDEDEHVPADLFLSTTTDLVAYTDRYVDNLRGKAEILSDEFEKYEKLKHEDKARCGLLVFRCVEEHECEDQLKLFRNELWGVDADGVTVGKQGSLWKTKYCREHHEENFNFWVMVNTATAADVIDIIALKDTTVEIKRFCSMRKYAQKGTCRAGLYHSFEEESVQTDKDVEEDTLEHYLEMSLMNSNIKTIMTKNHVSYYALEDSKLTNGKKRAHTDDPASNHKRKP